MAIPPNPRAIAEVLGPVVKHAQRRAHVLARVAELCSLFAPA